MLSRRSGRLGSTGREIERELSGGRSGTGCERRTWLFFSRHCQCFSNSVLQLSLIFLILFREMLQDRKDIEENGR